jgi:hypothetical protein
MAASGRTAPLLSGDELAERLKQQTAARIKESRQLLDAAKQKLKKTGKRGLACLLGGDGPAMTAQSADKPAQRATSAVVFLDAGQAATALA